MLARKCNKVFVPAALALHTQEAVLQQTALQILFEFLADELRQMTARPFDLLHKARVVPGNDGVQDSPFGAMSLVGG